MPSFWLEIFGFESHYKAAVVKRKVSFNIGHGSHNADNAMRSPHHHSTHRSINTAQDEKKHVKDMEREQTKCDGVRVIALSKTYDKVEALKNVYLEVSEGELLGVMGHNGAGKTTLINTLCGFVQRTSGNARVFELSIERDLEKIRRRMGIVSQFDVLWDELTALDHMHLFAEIKRV